VDRFVGHHASPTDTAGFGGGHVGNHCSGNLVAERTRFRLGVFQEAALVDLQSELNGPFVAVLALAQNVVQHTLELVSRVREVGIYRGDGVLTQLQLSTRPVNALLKRRYQEEDKWDCKREQIGSSQPYATRSEMAPMLDRNQDAEERENQRQCVEHLHRGIYQPVSLKELVVLFPCNRREQRSEAKQSEAKQSEAKRSEAKRSEAKRSEAKRSEGAVVSECVYLARRGCRLTLRHSQSKSLVDSGNIDSRKLFLLSEWVMDEMKRITETK